MADNPLRCPVCKTFLKKQKDGPKICVPCYFRNKAKEQAELKQANPTAPVKTNVRIGKL